MNSINMIKADLKSDDTGAIRRLGRGEITDPADVPHGEPSAAHDAPVHLPGDPLTPEIMESINALNELVNSSNQRLSISIDPVSGVAVFRVIDAATGDVVLQVPSPSKSEIEKALLIRRGILLDTNQ